MMEEVYAGPFSFNSRRLDSLGRILQHPDGPAHRTCFQEEIRRSPATGATPLDGTEVGRTPASAFYLSR